MLSSASRPGEEWVATRPRVRWLGATLKPAMLWPKPRLGLSTGPPPTLPGLSSPALLRNRPKLAQMDSQEPGVGTSSSPPLFSRGWGWGALMPLPCHQRTSVSQAGPPCSPALNALTDLQPLICHSVNLTKQHIIYGPEAKQAPRPFWSHLPLPYRTPTHTNPSPVETLL